MNSFTINSIELLKNVNFVAPVVREKPSLPILTNLLFECLDGVLKITASNNEIRSSVSMETSSEIDFSFCVSKALLSNILSSLPSIELMISVEEKEIIISSTLGVYNLPIESSLEYPKGESMGDLNTFKVDTDLFVDGLKKAIPFVDYLTENLDRILIKSENKKLNIAGLSNICFYEKEFDYNGDEIEVVLTTDSAKFLVQSIDTESELSIKYNKTFFCVYFDNVSIEVTQLSVVFPNYRKILNSLSKEKLFKIDLGKITSSVKRISSVSDKDNNTLIFDISENKVALKYQNKDYNHKLNEELDCEYTDEQIEIGFNIKKLKLILSILDSECEFYMTTPERPVLFVEENTRILLSPMKFN